MKLKPQNRQAIARALVLLEDASSMLEVHYSDSEAGDMARVRQIVDDAIRGVSGKFIEAHDPVRP